MSNRDDAEVPNVVRLVLGAPWDPVSGKIDVSWVDHIKVAEIPKKLRELARDAVFGSPGGATTSTILDTLASLGKHDFESEREFDLFFERFSDVVSDIFYRGCEPPSEDEQLVPEEAARRANAKHFADENVAKVLAAAWLHPCSPHSFELDLAAPEYQPNNAINIRELDVGGPNQLKVVASEQDARITTISGVVRAATFEGAIRRAERILDEFLGAYRAVGMCFFVDDALRPGTEVATIRMKDSGWRLMPEGESLPVRSLYTYRTRAAVFVPPPDMWEGETRALASKDFGKAFERPTRRVLKVLAGTSRRAAELRNACRLAVNAEDSNDFGIAITLACGALEGLLLPSNEKQETLGRLSEAVAHTLGRTVEERDVLRKRVKSLYNIRSIFVHTGQVQGRGKDREEALDLMYRVLAREMDHLPDINPKSIDGVEPR